MPATSRMAENTSVDNGPQQDYRPVTTKGRPMTTKGRPVTTKSRRPRQGSVHSLSSRMSSGSHKDQDGSKSIPGSDEKNDKRLLNRSRAQTSPSSKYHSSCSSSSSASSDSLNSSTSSFRPRTVQSYPSPDTINLTCRVSNDKPGYYEFLRPYSAYTPPLWKEPKLPQAFRDSKKLNHSSLTEGERFYLWRTATVYGLTDMKKQNQLRYEKLLRHTVETGFHTEEEVQKYMNYFKGTRKRQFKADPSVWRAPPRIPVRPLHFRKPPTSPRGWDSYSPQGSLGRGRSLKTTPSGGKSGKIDDTKDVKQEQGQHRNGKTPNTKPADENNKENNQEDEQQNKTELASAEQEGKNEEQPPPKIYYDMKLRRTVIRPDTGNAGKEAEEDSKTNSAKKTSGRDKGASLKDKNKSKDAKLDLQNPRPPSPPKVSWEDKEKREAEYSARPKTSRGRPQRATTARQKGDRMRADDSEEDTDIGRKSSTFSTTSSGSSSGSSSSGSSSNSGSSSSSSSRSSSRISRSSSSRSNSTIKGDNSPSRPQVTAAVGNKAWEGDDDDARAALARSFWNGSKGKGHENGESSQASSNKHEIASTSSLSKSTTGSDGNSSGSGTSRSSSQSGVKGHEEGESSQAGSETQLEYSEEAWEQDSDDARAAMAQSFWGKK